MVTRKLCKPQAMTMTMSEKLSLVFLKISFTIRERLTPERACSTLTRIFDILRFFSFSQSVSSLPRGFFSADTVFVLSVRSLETLYLYGVQSAQGTKSLPYQQPSCRGFCLGRSGSKTISVFSWQLQ